MGLKMGAGSSTAGAGELQVISIIASSAPGLSPLTRGTPDYLLFQSSHRRFIPAGAGNTIVFAPVSLSRSVYPRWRGEHLTTQTLILHINGLSPLARGTLTRSETAYEHCRFIPAGAGNTQITAGLTFDLTVYPRWRGEHMSSALTAIFAVGLSPLARGTRPAGQTDVPQSRFIPAGAGNTQISNRRVIPRFGLSPLARGTPRNPWLFSYVRRFIPAGAGNTDFMLSQYISLSVYPRWRGEHSPRALFAPVSNGLSPLARGTLSPHSSAAADTRFIPAGAGNTIFLPRLAPGKTVYPRWRGEHYPVPASGFTDGGLSPLARGTLPV